ncbi:uncharacterized protein LOC100888789 [Strongylocentrotus purpuratus]|uniref:B box-type domain-containing protein n=1 Tax=Strongylocentrotus purpuratus TaxID=7668 RepID=A0A7M7LL56_STRPU|nr:uncharacterized protein LOC100888789 [Strongylocentrotus purpuratus]|eukprot:XP_003724756.1 PREDICTED: uncharacterized protein LOC100888789 [Strongylocentrotus purpuratus]
MAANFRSAEDICEGDNCQSITDVTYYVKEKKKLCEDCASTGGCIGKARKGGPNLYCAKHDKDIDLYCKTHNEALCYSCAIIDHQQPCVQQDIEHAVIENRAKLSILKEKATDQLKVCRVYGDQIRQCRKDTDTHLQALKDYVDSVINEAFKKEEDGKKRDAAKINQEFDEKNNKLQEEIQKINEEIRKNDEEREKLLELNCTNAEKRREPIDNKQHGLQTDLQNIAEEKEKKIGELEKSWQNDTNIRETIIQKIDTVIEDDKNVVKDGHRVKTTVSDELKKPLSLNGGEVKQITCTLSGVKFSKGAGAGREKYDGRIDGYDGEWKLIDIINVNDGITFPTIVGYMDECNVIITDGLGGLHTYVLDMNTKHTQRVITSSDTSSVVACALLNDDKVVCGKYSKVFTRDSFTGYISVYDRQWKHINNVTIPRNTTYVETGVDVAVDQDGMIIAAEGLQSNIYVINPADGKIMNTITCKQKIRMNGVLSSGHIIARPSPADQRVFIIDRQGGQREIPHSDVILNACVDPMTDDLYVVTSDDEEMTCVIDQVMSGGEMKKRRVASFPLPTITLDPLSSRVMMTSSGKLIANDGDNILVFKKLLCL